MKRFFGFLAAALIIVLSVGIFSVGAEAESAAVEVTETAEAESVAETVPEETEAQKSNVSAPTVKRSNKNSFWNVTKTLFEGFGNTCLIFVLTLALALPLGLIINFGSMSKFKPLAYVVKTFIWIIRGVPLMLQVFIVFYVPGFLFGTPIMTRMGSVILAFVINYACYFAEIYRGGIEAIPYGQYEAGQVLGMTKSQVFFKVTLMQVVKRILAPMSNEVITLVKDTALARVILVEELIKKAENFASDAIIWPLFYTAVFYLASVGILTLLFGWFEKKLSYYKI